MILNSGNFDAFKNFFQAHQDMDKARLSLNKATNAIMSKKFYSKETKKTWQVINVYERGSFLSRYFEVWVEDVSTDLKFWSWQRLKYGWKHPRLMIPVEVLEEKIKKGILEVVEFEWEDKNESERFDQ
jgi:hypothetical protein